MGARRDGDGGEGRGWRIFFSFCEKLEIKKGGEGEERER